jgi:secreted Zn-dependent insulinase-like peptidase
MTRLLSHLVGHEGPGSVFAVLQDQGWATHVSAGVTTSQDDFALFEVRSPLMARTTPIAGRLTCCVRALCTVVR